MRIMRSVAYALKMLAGTILAVCALYLYESLLHYRLTVECDTLERDHACSLCNLQCLWRALEPSSQLCQLLDGSHVMVKRGGVCHRPSAGRHLWSPCGGQIILCMKECYCIPVEVQCEFMLKVNELVFEAWQYLLFRIPWYSST